MDLIVDWGWRMIDTIFAKGSNGGKHAPYGCRAGDHALGYSVSGDSAAYSPLCVGPDGLQIEDSEDIFIIIILFVGFLLTWFLIILLWLHPRPIIVRQSDQFQLRPVPKNQGY